MKVERLPSGNYRARVSIKRADGTYTTKSVTAATKTEVRRLAGLIKNETHSGDLLVLEACERFLNARELSPSTERGYRSTLKAYIEPDRIAAMKLSALSTATVQEWIARMPKGMSPKSKKNHLGFLTAVVGYFMEDKRFRVKIRDTAPRELYTPTVADINAVLAVADPVLERAIRLGMFGFRRGEICALEASDIDRKKNMVRISKAIAKGPGNVWVVKEPKTKSSIRWVQLPQEVINILPKRGRIVPVSPDVVTLRWTKAVERAGVPHFRFHDLRAFFASISVSSAIGASELTVQKIGGWKTNNVLRMHYERSISDQQQKDTDRIMKWYRKEIPVAKTAGK